MTPRVRPVVLDTDVASAAFKSKPLPILAKVATLDPVISFVTYGELTKWAEIRGWAPHNRAMLRSWIARMPVLHSTEPVAETWGRLAAEAMKRGRPRPQNDMWVAAVCITYGLPLATLNLKDYQDFADHDGLEFVKVGSCR